MDQLIRAEGLQFSYPGEDPVLRGVELELRRGELLFLVGRSGAGKTTLLRLLQGQLRPTGGSLEVNGLDMSHASAEQIRRLRGQMGVVFQEFRLLRGRSAFDNVAISLRMLGVRGAELRQRTREALEAVGLGDRPARRVESLSWGQQQRVALARALVRQPVLLLADEPTGNLDPETAEIVVDLLVQAQRQNVAVVIVTHDRLAVERAGGMTATLREGRLAVLA